MSEEMLQHIARDSIEVSRNAKGDVAWKAKLYFDEDSQGHDDTVAKLRAIDAALKEGFM